MTTTTVTAPKASKAQRALTTADVLKGISKTGPALDSTTAGQVLSLLVSERETEQAAPALTTANDQVVKSAEAALVAARQAGKAIAAKAGEARVNLVRGLTILTTDAVRGSKSITGAEAAKALGVSAAYVSQSVALGRALHRMGGVWSYPALVAAEAARDQGAPVLVALVESATAKASERVKGEGTVKVSTSDVLAARADVAPTVTATKGAAEGKGPDTVAVRLVAQTTRVDAMRTGLAGGFVGTADDRTALLAAIDAYRADVAGLVIPKA